MSAQQSYETIRLEIADGIARLTLARPAVLNAMNRPMMGELNDAFERIGGDDTVRVVVLTAQGRGFCSGADLGGGQTQAGTRGYDPGAVLEQYINPLIERMFALQKPIVAGVQGAAAGAGCMLALAADIVIASRSAYFLQAFVRNGLVPDAGSMWLLPRLVGRARAQAMMLLAEKIPAETARDWGLIFEVTEDDALDARLNAVAGKLAVGPTRAYALIRSGVRQALEQPLSATLAMERDAQREAGATEDFLEGIAAFRAKRPPQFKGS